MVRRDNRARRAILRDMGLRQTYALAATIASTAPALGDSLHCLGRDPPFMMVIEDDSARFDYLGDGLFDLDPALTLPETGVTRLTLSTFGGPLPVYVERRACLAFGTVLDFTVEIGVQTSQGMQPMIGCCREAR
jgi:hypothetical protein